MSLTNTHYPALERGRLRVVIATIVINVIAVSLLPFAPWSDWRTGAALNFVDNCLLIGFMVVRRDALLARFLLFGVVVGLTELAADAWLVDYTRTLDYSIGGGPMIWRSPLNSDATREPSPNLAMASASSMFSYGMSVATGPNTSTV